MKKLIIAILVAAPFLGLAITAKSFLLADSKPAALSHPKVKAQAALVLPKAVTDETTFKFGQMDPLTMGTHSFVIKNTGKAPLKLQLGETSCKCTFGKLKDSSIAPGESGEVTLTWNTGNKHAVYSNGARVHTNDPRNRSIVFRVEGLVRRQLGIDPPEIVLSHVAPDSSPAAECLLFSQAWSKFEVEDLESTLQGLQWEATPLEQAEISRREAKSGQRLKVTLPADMPTGFFQHALTLKVRVDEETELQEFEIPLMGKVLRRLSAYGANIDASGVITLGVLQSGAEHKNKVLLKVRDSIRELKVDEIKVTPSFVKVSVEPSPGLERKGLYVMNIEVPRNAPAGSFSGARRGQVELVIDHPRIDALKLKLDFTIFKSR